MTMTSAYKLGAQWLGDGHVHFLVWAPAASRIDVHLMRHSRRVALEKDALGYFSGVIGDIAVGDTYFYDIDGVRERPDPASRRQPDGVHGPSEVVDPFFHWTDANFTPPTLRNSVFYELHIGTFTPEGTFLAAIEHFERLCDFGITSLNVMPVAQIPGAYNWGYDGVQLFAPQKNYGTPHDFKTMINAAHRAGLAVYLDVVYNHLGPEGNYLWDYGPYFSTRYKGAWGDNLNFDGPHSDEVRRFFLENAVYWLEEFHIDGLRLDATQALIDLRAVPFLEELGAHVHEWADSTNRHVHLIAESNQSDRKLVLPRTQGGTGMDAQWLDDFHNSVHAALTGETAGYYGDYADFARLVKILRTRHVLTGDYSLGAKRRHGTDASDIPADRFVVSVQTHDHVGNRMLGDRIMPRSGFEANKLAAGYLLTSPYTPMFFMGQEYGETAPFLFFTDFGDAHLIEAVRAGRKADHASFFHGDIEAPDPQHISSFERSKLNHALRMDGEHALLYAFSRALLTLRRTLPALTNPNPIDFSVHADAVRRIFCMERRHPAGTVRIVLNWHLNEAQRITLPTSSRAWRKIFDSAGAEWQPDGVSRATATEEVDDEHLTLNLPPKSLAIYV